MVHGYAIHVGVGVPSARIDPPLGLPSDVAVVTSYVTYLQLAEMAVTDASALCLRVGIPTDDQRILRETDATLDQFQAAIGEAGRAVADDGMLVVSFAGHGREPTGAGSDRDVAWQLYDADLREPALLHCFDVLAPSVRVVVVGDHCFGLGELPMAAAVPGQRVAPTRRLISISATGLRTRRMVTRATLANRIEQAMFTPVTCASWRELAGRLRADLTFAPEVWCSDADDWSVPPFT